MASAHIKVSCLDCRLAELCLPYGLGRADVQQLSRLVNRQRLLQSDTYLYEQGSECLNLYAVKSGSFRSFMRNSDGTEQTLGFYLPGELIGLDGLENGRFSCSLIALETGAVCEVPLTKLNALCRQVDGLQMQLLRILGKEIASDHHKIVLLGHKTARERLAIFLLMLSSRYNRLGFSATCFSLSMRRQDIANFLGLTIETVSRQLAQLSSQGIISIKQRAVEIHDLSALMQIVEPCHEQQPHCS